MNKSPQYNQQTELKQCKSEVEKIICIHQRLETGVITASTFESGSHARKNSSEETH